MKTYFVNCSCSNCQWTGQIKFDYGTIAEVHKVLCPCCGCLGYLSKVWPLVTPIKPADLEPYVWPNPYDKDGTQTYPPMWQHFSNLVR